MKKEKYSSLGLDIDLSVPDSEAEFNANAGKEGACLAEATNNVVYRGMLATFRYHFLHGISEKDLADDSSHKSFVEGTTPIEGVDVVTGIERKEVPVLDKEGKPRIVDGEPLTQYDPDDSEAKYFKRVCAEKNLKPENFQDLANRIAAALVFDASASERKAVGPKKLAAKYKEKAARILAGNNVAALQAKYEGLVRNPDGSAKSFSFTATNDQTKTFVVKWKNGDGAEQSATVSDKDAESLGWLAKEYVDAVAAQGLDQVV
jgi:hypothetical protein